MKIVKIARLKNPKNIIDLCLVNGCVIDGSDADDDLLYALNRIAYSAARAMKRARLAT